MRRQDPALHLTPIGDLRPTQMTIGLLEVVEQRKKWRAAKAKDRAHKLTDHVAPGVIGPKGWFYIVDHHHLVRALYEEGVSGVFVQTLADFSSLEKDEFWMVLDHHGWAHPYDENGRRADYSAVPKQIGDLMDDPYRSLAGAVRRAGGFAKETAPFAEFLWASFYRTRIDRQDLLDEFEQSLETALSMAHMAEASYLPGWCGER